MINLIPPQAKREIKVEYWIRVVSVWLMLFGVMFMVTAVLMFPSYVLVSTQLSAVTQTTDTRADDIQVFKDVEAEVVTANKTAALLTTEVITVSSHEIVSTLESISTANIIFVGFSASREQDTFTEVVLRGVATNRAALVEYKDAVEAHELFSAAELPLSNFAENENIQFTMNITIAES